MINFERRGSGAPLVLVHGIGSRWQIWEPVLDALAERFDVIAVDLPGFGISPHPGGRIDVYRLADEVEKLCTDLGVERPHIAGNSMGGGIALELGRRGLARSVTAFSPIGYWGRPGLVWTRLVLRAARAALRASRPVLPKLLAKRAARTGLLSLVFGKPGLLEVDTALLHIDGLLGAPAFDETLRAFADYRVPDAGALRNVPVTIAWGTRDVLLTYRTQSAQARKALPTATHVPLRGSGHTPFSDDPAACADVILSQLKAGSA